MSEVNEKIQIIRTWLSEIQQNAVLDPIKFSPAQITLNEMLSLIQHDSGASSDPGVSATYADLERQVQEQTSALNQATNALKSQITERETAARKLRKAYNNLEIHLQEHIAYQSRLNQRLQEQIDEQKRTQAIEQEERILTEALRDTLATMSSFGRSAWMCTVRSDH